MSLGMENVSMIDMTAMVALKSILDTFKENNTLLIISGLEKRMLKKLAKISFIHEEGSAEFYDNIQIAIKSIKV